MKKKPWWETEWISKQKKEEIEETEKWLENETIIKEFKDKEEIIINAYNKEISKKRDEIEQLYKDIKNLEKECSKCLAKIYNGDTGLRQILEEKNILKSTQIQTEIVEN